MRSVTTTLSPVSVSANGDRGTRIDVDHLPESQARGNPRPRQGKLVGREQFATLFDEVRDRSGFERGDIDQNREELF